MEYVIIGFALFAFIHIFYAIAIIKTDFSVIDIGWGLGISLVSLVSWFLGKNEGMLPTIITLLICTWGVRLSSHIGYRNAGNGEDPRYTKFRNEWGESANIKAYFLIFWGQGILMILMAMPAWLLNFYGTAETHHLIIPGAVLSVFGLVWEIWADASLLKYKGNPDNKGKLCQVGPWKWSRFPNYFGETVFWWGVFFLSLNSPFMLYGIISPLLITLLLQFVSGIPMTERHMRKKYAEYAEYEKRTNRFIPRPQN